MTHTFTSLDLLTHWNRLETSNRTSCICTSRSTYAQLSWWLWPCTRYNVRISSPERRDISGGEVVHYDRDIGPVSRHRSATDRSKRDSYDSSIARWIDTDGGDETVRLGYEYRSEVCSRECPSKILFGWKFKQGLISRKNWNSFDDINFVIRGNLFNRWEKFFFSTNLYSLELLFVGRSV